MPSERTLRIGHTPLFTLIALTSIVTLAISAALVKYYNDHGYPSGAYKPRLRIILVAAVWTTAFSLYLLFGFLFRASSILFGVLAHWVPLTISFILYLIGTAATTALTNGTNCSSASEGFARCNIVKADVGLAWTSTILVFIAWVLVTALAFKARGSLGVRNSTFLDV